jgi:hypothetical protein
MSQHAERGSSTMAINIQPLGPPGFAGEVHDIDLR